MGDMSDVARSLRSTFKTLDGRRFLGELTLPSPTIRPDNFDPAGRLLRVGMSANVKAGDIIIIPPSRRYLVGTHTSNYSRDIAISEFRLFEMTSLISWKREVTIVDPVTKLPRRSSLQDMGLINITFIKTTETRDSGTSLPEITALFITNVDLQPGDKLGDDYVVAIVTPYLGVTMGQVR